MFKPGRKLRAREDRDAYDLIDRYLEQLECQKSGEQEPFVKDLKEYTGPFGDKSIRRSKLDKRSPLLIKIIEYHFDTEGWEVVTSEVESLGELSNKLAESLRSCVRAQLLCFSLNENLPSRHFGKAAVQRETQMLRSLSTTLLCVIGARWEISAPQIWQLAGFRSWVGRQGSARIRLPSQPKDDSLDLNAQSIRRIAVTASPERFESDIAQYINQKHCDAPRPESITFYYDGQHEACWRGVLTCSTAGVTEEISKRLALPDMAHRELEELALDPRVAMTAISKYMVDMVGDNLAKISDYLKVMKYESRKSPSYGKLNYVLHLQDHLEILLQLFAPSQETTEEWPTIANKPSDQQRLAKIRTDRDYIISIAKELQTESEKLQAMIKQQVEGKNNSRTTLFAIIAAVYLPLTLATGIFGMNIKQITASKTTPSWQNVVYLGLPLVGASVAVPLTADRVYRLIQKYAGARPRLFRWWLYWGPILLIAIIVVVIVVVVKVTKG